MNKVNPRCLSRLKVPHCCQQGVTLLEVLVALALGVFFLGVAVNYLIVGQQSNQVQDSTSRAQENARFASNLLRDSMRLAGYRAISGVTPDFFHDGACDIFDPCTGDSLGDRGDTIAVVSVADNAVNQDCLGVAVANQIAFANVFWVDDIDGDGVTSLYCRGWNVMNNDWNDNAGPQPLVDGIEQMQVQYGISVVDPNNLDDFINDPVARYVSAEGLSDIPGDASLFVRSVRFALLVDSGLQTDASDVAGGAALQDAQRSYALLDGDPVVFNDNRIRRVFTATVELNNTFQ